MTFMHVKLNLVVAILKLVLAELNLKKYRRDYIKRAVAVPIWNFGKRSKVPDKKPPGQKAPDNKPPRIIEEIIARYAVDTNLFWLGTTNSKKKIQSQIFFFAFIQWAYCRGTFDLEPKFFWGPVLVSDIQTSSPPLPFQKWPTFFFVSKTAQYSETYANKYFTILLNFFV